MSLVLHAARHSLLREEVRSVFGSACRHSLLRKEVRSAFGSL